MHPPQVVPYYHRASRTFEQNDITVTTLVTFNPFKVCSGLTIVCPISVTHTPLLDALRDLCVSTPAMSTYVDIHLVFTLFDRQLNTWRNTAHLFSCTKFAMMLDVDFIICTNFRSATRASLEVKIGRILKEEHAAIVVPAFEYVTQYHPAYEPYVIFGKEGPSWYQLNPSQKSAACLYEMYLSGMSFCVLANHFFVHQSHAYEEEARTLERKSNRKIYQDFKEEVYLLFVLRPLTDDDV
ncbi:glycosyltransferase family 49 protein [Suillus subluteus]|nr:glycosyltransferase family 49 protein [Suillus subluteus]